MKKKVLFTIIILSLVICSCNIKEGNNSDKNSDTVISIESLSQQIRKTPKDSKLFSHRAELYFEEDNIKEAINDMKIALRLDSLNEKYYIKIAEYQLINVDVNNAIESLLFCIKINPQNGEARLKLANIYYYKQDYASAITELEEIETRKLQNADSYFLKGLIFDETELYDKAIECLKLSIEYDSEKWEAYDRIALIYAGNNDKKAIDYYESSIQLFPKNLDLRYNAGLIFQQFKLYDKAIDEYNYVINNSKDAKDAHENLGIILINYKKDYKAAINEFTKTIEIDSLDHTAWYNRGYCYEKLKQYKNAETNYRQCLKILPNYDLAVEGLNEVLEKSH